MTTNSKGNGIVMTGSHVFAVLLAVKVFSIENLKPPWRETLFLLLPPPHTSQSSCLFILFDIV